MDRIAFKHLETKYSQHASWAVWNSHDLEDTTVIRENPSDLKTSVVMVALNISKHLPSPWRNFHSRDHARKLMYAFNQSPYRGAYMTDIIKEYVEPNSLQLQKQLSRGRLEVLPHVEMFREEMKDLGAKPEALFILFGGNVTRVFNKYLSEKFPNRISCTHYSMFGRGFTDAEWVEKVWSILESKSQVATTASEAPAFVVSNKMRAELTRLLSKGLCSRRP